MQMNQHVDQVQKTTRPPHIDHASSDTHATLETRTERMSVETPRRPPTRLPAHEPGRYGAGF
jgi:uncharacterized protein (DUF2267 family)